MTPREVSLLAVLANKHPDEPVNLDDLNLGPEAREMAERIIGWSYPAAPRRKVRQGTRYAWCCDDGVELVFRRPSRTKGPDKPSWCLKEESCGNPDCSVFYTPVFFCPWCGAKLKSPEELAP